MEGTFPLEYNVENVIQTLDFVRLGKILAPIFTDKNWNKLLETHKQFDEVVSPHEYRTVIYAIARQYHDFVQTVLEAFAEEDKRMAIEKEKQDAEFERQLQWIEDNKDGMQEVLEKWLPNTFKATKH
jgi:hypothetical protein